MKSQTQLAANPEIQAKNGLLYVLPQALASTVNKTYIRQAAQRSSYDEGDTIVFDLNTGSRYIDPENSYLMFDVFTDGGPLTKDTNYTAFNKDVGALALLNEFHCHAKSGVELDRIQQVNQYAYSRAQQRENQDYWSRFASIFGGGTRPDGGVPILGQCSADPHRVAIPMKIISGLFDPVVKGMKMPPGLVSGARIEITLESFGRAFSANQGSDDSKTYTVTNPIIVMMSHELGDNSQRVLNEESTESGLEYTYPRVFTTLEPSSSNTVNIQIKKAVAQANRVFAVPILSSGATSQAADSFNSSLVYTRYQYRVGSLFYPQQRIDTRVEGFMTTLNSYGKLTNMGWYSPHLTYDQYVDSENGRTILGVGLMKDDKINISGVPINNSATLELQATVAAGGVQRNWYVFMEYTACAKSFLTNVEVKI